MIKNVSILFLVLSVGMVHQMSGAGRDAPSVPMGNTVSGDFPSLVDAQLREAVREGRMDQAEEALDGGGNVDFPIDGENTLLLYAVKTRNEQMALLLVNRGANLCAVDERYLTPLYHACFQGFLELVNLMLSRGADYFASDSNGNQPIHAAVIGGGPAIVRALLEAGAHATVANERMQTPLHILCTLSSLSATDIKAQCEVGNLLIKGGGGADINRPNADGHTPLMLAALYDCDGLIPLLLEAGALPNATNARGQTVLDLLDDERREVVSVLTSPRPSRLSGWCRLL